MANNNSDSADIFCKTILYSRFESVDIRLWDVLILVPNLLFLVFLCIRFKRARLKLYATNSPIFLCFYGLIWICAILSVLRCAISMLLSSLHVNPKCEDVGDKVLWTVVRLVLLMAEMSVLIFSLAFGNLESRHSIKRVLITTGIISLVYSSIQGGLELWLPNGSFSIEGGVFGHGGVVFLLVTSSVLMLVYLAVYLLPYTPFPNVIPVKPVFYRYAFILFCSCLAITIGCILLLTPFSFADSGYCLINLSHYLYYSGFIPLVYLIFLNDYCYHPTKIPFSYTMNESMYDEGGNSIESNNTYLEDDDAFIHQAACHTGGGPGASSCADSANATQYSQSTMTHPNNFVLNGPPMEQNYHRFLYNTNIQSPGSLTGYSSVEESTTATASAHGSMEFIQHRTGGQIGGGGGGNVAK